jgi:hypothetical protein
VKIVVNEMPIDFQLEDEENAGSVVNGVTQWLVTNNHVIERVEINGIVREPEDATWRSLPLVETEEIRISARSQYERQIEKLETLISYAGLLRRVMMEGNDDQVRAVLEELPYVVEGITAIAPDLEGLLEEPLRETGSALPDEPTRRQLADRASELASLFENRQRELLDPEHEMALTLTVLDDLLPRFEEIPSELQSGQAQQAMATVARFTEVAGRVLRILPRVAEVRPALQSETVEGKPFNEAIGGINELLGELEEAFRNSDYVLVGDILEYEILPRFSALSSTVATHVSTPR